MIKLLICLLTKIIDLNSWMNQNFFFLINVKVFSYLNNNSPILNDWVEIYPALCNE